MILALVVHLCRGVRREYSTAIVRTDTLIAFGSVVVICIELADLAVNDSLELSWFPRLLSRVGYLRL